MLKGLLKGFQAVALIMVLTTGIFMPSVVFADDEVAAAGSVKDCSKSFLGIPTWYAYLKVDPDCMPLNANNKPIEGIDDIAGVIPKIVIAVVDALLRVAGVVAFIFIVASGFRFVLAQGSPDKEKQARSALFNAIIGAVIATSAAFIVSFIGRRLG